MLRYLSSALSAFLITGERSRCEKLKHAHARTRVFTAPRRRKVCSHSVRACLGSDCVLSLCGMSQAGRAGSRFHWQETNAHPFLWAGPAAGEAFSSRREGKKWEDAAFSKELLTSGGRFLTLVLT